MCGSEILAYAEETNIAFHQFTMVHGPWMNAYA